MGLNNIHHRTDKPIKIRLIPSTQYVYEIKAL